jgi:hypothetical protein
MTLTSLVGEQPIPNLLAARAVNASLHLLFYTEKTPKIARKMKVIELPGFHEDSSNLSEENNLFLQTQVCQA